MIKKYSLESLQETLLGYQVEKRRAEKTKKRNRTNLNILLPEVAYKEFLAELGEPDKPTEEAYRQAYYRGLVKKLGAGLELTLKAESAPATKNSRLATARMILKALEFDKYITKSELEVYLKTYPLNKNVKRDKKTPIPITDDEFKKLMGAVTISADPSQYGGRRDKLTYMLMRKTGAKPSEVVNLTYQDIDFLGQVITLINKDGKRRTAPIDEETIQYLFKYIRAHDKNETPLSLGEDKLLRNKHDKQIDTRSLRRNFERDMKKAGLARRDDLVPESLRYGFVEEKVNEEIDEKDLDKRINAKDLADLIGIQKGRAEELIGFLKKR